VDAEVKQDASRSLPAEPSVRERIRHI